MSQGLMNRLFKMGVVIDKIRQADRAQKLFHHTGAQATMFNELRKEE